MSMIRQIVGFFLLVSFVLGTSANSTRWDRNKYGDQKELESAPPLQLLRTDPRHVVLDNGLLKLTLSVPEGFVAGIEYNGIENLLEWRLKESHRGYWDLVWSNPNNPHNVFDVFEGTSFNVISADENHIEVSFPRTWNFSNDAPLNLDKRYVMLRGSSGFYSYAIYDHLDGWPDIDIEQSRMAFKLQTTKFKYMAISDDRQRIMPSGDERRRGQKLAYPEAVKLPDDLDTPLLRGEVDDKYQYSANVKDCHVHGWISGEPRVGFWMIAPSDEFRAGGPLKQELTSHVGPTTLMTFFSGHYAGSVMSLKLRDGEPWKKVFGPIFIYVNKGSVEDDYQSLWDDAKNQAAIERRTWPYDFPQSIDYPHASGRGTVNGRLLVQDRYVNEEALIIGSDAYVGLAPVGEAGSWQYDSKGYQFWNQSDADGNFMIRGVRPGIYNMFYWVPGFIGDSKYNATINILGGDEIAMGDVIYEPPRNGPTLWEIGVPDRTAAEFYVPDPYPNMVNYLYINHTEKFRQYGLWDRYTDLYPENDLVYTVGVSDYKKDWFFAHVNRRLSDGSYDQTEWQIEFDLPYVSYGYYTLHLALASGNGAKLRVVINGDMDPRSVIGTGVFGRDNAIARHGIHGLYMLRSFNVRGSLFHPGRNVISLRQLIGGSKFDGFMYDYIRLEGPPS